MSVVYLAKTGAQTLWVYKMILDGNLGQECPGYIFQRLALSRLVRHTALAVRFHHESHSNLHRSISPAFAFI